MATAPSAKAKLQATGSGVGSGDDYLVVFGCASAGPYTPRVINTYSDALATYDVSEMEALADQWFGSGVGKPLVMVRVPSASAGVISNQDEIGVTGTSVVTFTGSPRVRARVVVKVLTAGTIGANGITFAVSMDGGRSYGKTIRLGTANSYTLPLTGGCAVGFAAGTLAAGDIASAVFTPPMWNAAGLTAGREALAATPYLARAGIVLGDISDDDLLQSVIDEATAYENVSGRHIRLFAQVREPYATARLSGVDVDFDATLDQVTIAGANFTTAGFKVGMDASISGTTLNNGAKGTVVTVGTTILTLSATPGLATEANVAGAIITGTESLASWRASLGADIVGLSEATRKVSDKVMLRGGNPRRKCVDGSRRQLPFSYFSAIQTMSADMAVSEAQVDRGPIGGITIVDADGILETHDERVHGGLLALGIGCPTTHDGFAGVYSALAVTLADDASQLSRSPIGFVGDLLCRLAKREGTKKLSKRIILQKDGTPDPAEKARIEKEITSVLRAATIPNGRASDVSCTMDGSVDLREVAAEVNFFVDYLPVGYLEKLTFTVAVASAAGDV